MKKLLLLFVGVGLMSSVAIANPADQFMIDEFAVEALFESSNEVSFSLDTAELFAANAFGTISNEKDAVVAFVLAWFVGSLGVHRLYLGTAPLTFVGYILTLGGCGIAAFGDWIVLLLAVVGSRDLSLYVDNPRFFMWAGN